jgi:hypothetical protein
LRIGAVIGDEEDLAVRRHESVGIGAAAAGGIDVLELEGAAQGAVADPGLLIARRVGGGKDQLGAEYGRAVGDVDVGIGGS